MKNSFRIILNDSSQLNTIILCQEISGFDMQRGINLKFNR